MNGKLKLPSKGLKFCGRNCAILQMLALDFPHVRLQFFPGLFHRQEKNFTGKCIENFKKLILGHVTTCNALKFSIN